VSTLLEARGLDFAYPGSSLALHGVSLAIEPRTLTAIIGANGSGKSTLIRLLAGLLVPAAGEVRLDGKPLAVWLPRARARQIAYVPQSMSVAFPFAALDVVLTGRSPHLNLLGFEDATDRGRAMDALAAVGADHLAGRQVTSLSGGERQMVMLARALAQEPRILLLDEPSASLDLKHRAGLMRTLAGLREARGLSVVMVTHDLQLTGALFDRVVALRHGELAADGPPAAVLQTEQLSSIYDDAGVRTCTVGNQILVWTEL